MEDLDLRYDPRFMEEAVFLALQGHRESRLFETERNCLYEIADAEERERKFQALNVTWFERLGMAKPIERAVHERALVCSSVKSCVISRAPGKKEEGAELFVNNEHGLSETERRTVRILLRPESLLNPDSVLAFLRHELFHVADMLDPRFGYNPVLPAAAGGPMYDLLLKERYRVLWDATIDGRIARLGWVPRSARTEHLWEFCHAFPMFGNESDQIFRRFFDEEGHTHGELVAFAITPTAVLKDSTATLHPGNRCSLCGFPTYVFEPAPEHLPAALIAEIVRDFPRWHPARGICAHCVDLYRSYVASGGNQRHIPGGIKDGNF